MASTRWMGVTSRASRQGSVRGALVASGTALSAVAKERHLRPFGRSRAATGARRAAPERSPRTRATPTADGAARRRGTSYTTATHCAPGRVAVVRTADTVARLSETEACSPVPEAPQRGPEPRKATSCERPQTPERRAPTRERRGRAPERRALTRKRPGHPPERKSPGPSGPSLTSEPTKPVTDGPSLDTDGQVQGPCTRELATCANHRPRTGNHSDS
jgi:hypothetical protein